MIAGKTLVDCANYSLLMNIKRMTKKYVSTLKTNMAKENVSLDFRQRTNSANKNKKFI